MPDRDWRTVRLFEADCVCCVVVVEGFSHEEEEPGWLHIEILGSSTELWRRNFSTRVSRAWDTFMAKPAEFMTITSPATADALIDAMFSARGKAWGDAR